MKTYYNSETKEFYYEGNSLTILKDGELFSGIPNEEKLLELGYEEWHEPAPTEEELLERAKQSKIAEIETYDASDAVNSFTIGSQSMWLDAATRQQLRISLDACYTMGRETVTKWFDGVEYTFPITNWFQMLTALEVYAADALNVTESHKAAISSLSTVNDVESYDYMTGYPNKLVF